MTKIQSITEKIQLVQQEMKTVGLWKNKLPSWVNNYEKRNIVREQDFNEWLQFVYLPNRLLHTENSKSANGAANIVLQAEKFFGDDLKKGTLLRLLIELDALS